MPSSKISALPEATVLVGTDVLPVVNSGLTKKVTVDNLSAALGGGGPSSLIAFWSGLLPPAAADGVTVVVPTEPDGTSLDYEIQILRARVDSPSAFVPVQFRVQRSAGGGSFSGTTVGDVTVAAGAYENQTTGLSFNVSSGDLLRLLFIAVGPSSTFYVQALASIIT